MHVHKVGFFNPLLGPFLWSCLHFNIIFKFCSFEIIASISGVVIKSILDVSPGSDPVSSQEHSASTPNHSKAVHNEASVSKESSNLLLLKFRETARIDKCFAHEVQQIIFIALD